MIAARDGVLALGILGPVHEPAQIAALPVTEGVDLVDDVQQAAETPGQRPPRVEQAARVAVRQEHPERVLRRRKRRHVARKRAQAGDLAPEPRAERQPDPDHGLRVVLDRPESAQDRRGIGARDARAKVTKRASGGGAARIAG